MNKQAMLRRIQYLTNSHPKTMKHCLLYVLFCLSNMTTNAQTIKAMPVNEIFIDNKVVFNDSTNLINKAFYFWHCDSIGNLTDTFTGLYLLKINKHNVIQDKRQAKNMDSTGNEHYSKLCINKIDQSKWNGRIRHKNKLRTFEYYSARSNAWYTKTIRAGEIKTVYLY